MKRFGTGTLGVGIIGLGWCLSVGIVSIGMNAVGWIAIGMNAAGFVSVGLINSIGVFSFGGVNACGAWGRGGVNAEGSGEIGIVVSVLVVLGFLVQRVRTWPGRDVDDTVPLAVAAGSGGQMWARARLRDAGETIALRDGSTELRAVASPELHERCAKLGRGARVRVRVKRVARPVETAGYRDDAATLVDEIVDLVPDPRGGWLRTAFGDLLGAQMILSWLGLVASIVAYFTWR